MMTETVSETDSGQWSVVSGQDREDPTGLTDHSLLTTDHSCQRRRREIEFLAGELFRQVEGLRDAVGDLVPAELAAGDGELALGAPLHAVAQQLDDALACFDLLQEELGLPAGQQPRYRRLLRDE
jgi:hypothetical protein